MAKSVRAIICVIVSFAVMLPCVLFSVNNPDNPPVYADTDYYSDLNIILSKYGNGVSSDEKDEYALSRILVNGWNGKDYGADMTAYDRQNDFAVLQYKSPTAAQKAEKKMLSDGLDAEPDSVAKLTSSEKCTICPEYSSALGVDTYLDSFAMTSDDVTVAVIDTGVMYDHTAIADRFVSEGIDLSGDGCANAYYNVEETGNNYGHGTFVCGIIADNTPDSVSILPIKAVQFETENTSAAAIVSGINYAVNNGAKVISISLYSNGAESSYRTAINNALSKGVIVCTSAGNDSQEITERYPACIEGVITVSALESNLTDPASFTNYGDVIDFCAPGRRVHSTYPSGGESSYRNWSGTSFSAPYIAALCADIKSIDCEMSKDDVYQTLCDFAVDLGDSGYDVYCGNGMPYLGNMVYSESNVYSLTVPQGNLSIFASADYTPETQPWHRFAKKIRRVSIDSSVSSIGDYMFYNLYSASFTLSRKFSSVGDYAFYNCQRLRSMTFGINVQNIGYKAFGEIDGFTVRGYLNTPAEIYALNENTKFVKLGCKHNYFYEVFEPDGDIQGYTLYTCSVCGDTYTGEYITPVNVISGSCGENLTYHLDDTGKLTIDGSGDMYDYISTPAPWHDYADDIRILNIKSGATSVSPFAFYGCNGIVKMYVSENNASLSTDSVTLFNKTKTEVVLTFARGSCTFPDSVTTVSTPAFIAADNIALNSNANLSVKDGIIYDLQGNIVASLPNYRERTLVVDKPITISDYAFILTGYPERFETGVLSVFPGEYSLGYTFSGSMVKNDFTVKACAQSGAAAYAIDNGFTLEGGVYQCGNELTYSYDSDYTTLKISGTGAMTEYSSLQDIPWNSILNEVTTLEIGDNVTSVSPYSFNGASGLTYLTMPVSLEAPEDNTTWNGCTAIKTLTLTHGNGIMDDYLGDGGEKYYMYTPWYISASSITNMTIDSDVKYIGNSAFRACYAITDLTLNCVEEIAPDALLACSQLRYITIYSKNAVLADYSMISYSAYGRKIYQNFYLRGYSDSTVKDYCDRLEAQFVSIGCGHSRDVVLQSTVTEGLTVTSTYFCNDCLEEFTQITDISSSVSGTLVTTDSSAISGALITVDGNTAVTDGNGRFTVTGLSDGTSQLSVALHGVELFTSPVTVTDGGAEVRITIRYADYVTDGVINAKDFAFALKNGFDDNDMFSFGKIQSRDNKLETVEQ